MHNGVVCGQSDLFIRCLYQQSVAQRITKVMQSGAKVSLFVRITVNNVMYGNGDCILRVIYERVNSKLNLSLKVVGHDERGVTVGTSVGKAVGKTVGPRKGPFGATLRFNPAARPLAWKDLKPK